jgi:hypothetical protein
MYTSLVSRAAISVLLLLFLVACSGAAAPTLVPTVALLLEKTPTLVSAETPPPTQTPEPTNTLQPPPGTDTPRPTATAAPAPDVTVTPTAETSACDADTVAVYVDVVEQLSDVYASLEQQEFSEDAMLASILQMERLLEQANGLPTPCDRAFWLRQTLVNEIGAEIEDLEGFATGTIKGDPQSEIAMREGIEMALDALRQEVGGQTEQQAQATNTPAPSAWDCSGDFYDCSYFRSQNEAQQCYDYCSPRAGDIHKLDEDGDGVACESLP